MFDACWFNNPPSTSLSQTWDTYIESTYFPAKTSKEEGGYGRTIVTLTVSMHNMLALRRQQKTECHDDPILHQQTTMLAATRSDMLARVKAAINGEPRDDFSFNLPRHHVDWNQKTNQQVSWASSWAHAVELGFFGG